ncbi:MAG TPA: DUF3859 domain-containing protein [Thermoanaerobaculia bacterium]|nr:DUF3859 domain-containing protein [Thermoanaerobaculia bacterium]
MQEVRTVVASALAVGLCWAQGCSAAEAQPVGRLAGCGITRDAGKVERTPNSAVPNGAELRVSGMSVATETDVIPARLGVAFGCRFEVTGFSPGEEVELFKVVSFPEMRLPDGSVSTGYRRSLGRTKARSDGTVATVQGYSLDESFEAVEDVWSIEIWLEGRRLAAKKFQVVSAGDAGAQ